MFHERLGPAGTNLVNGWGGRSGSSDILDHFGYTPKRATFTAPVQNKTGPGFKDVRVSP